MPEPEFTATDYVNPDAPEDERRIRPDHRRVRDLSYDAEVQRTSDIRAGGFGNRAS
jgi:hypothetical protein